MEVIYIIGAVVVFFLQIKFGLIRALLVSAAWPVIVGLVVVYSVLQLFIPLFVALFMRNDRSRSGFIGAKLDGLWERGQFKKLMGEVHEIIARGEARKSLPDFQYEVAQAFSKMYSASSVKSPLDDKITLSMELSGEWFFVTFQRGFPQGTDVTVIKQSEY